MANRLCPVSINPRKAGQAQVGLRGAGMFPQCTGFPAFELRGEARPLRLQLRRAMAQHTWALRHLLHRDGDPPPGSNLPPPGTPLTPAGRPPRRAGGPREKARREKAAPPDTHTPAPTAPGRSFPSPRGLPRRGGAVPSPHRPSAASRLWRAGPPRSPRTTWWRLLPSFLSPPPPPITTSRRGPACRRGGTGTRPGPKGGWA